MRILAKEIQRKDQRNSRNRGVECHVIQGKRERAKERTCNMMRCYRESEIV